jgi:hypothetical protein
LTQFSHNFPSIQVTSCRNRIKFLAQFSFSSSDLMQKSNQIFGTIFHLFGTKWT